MRHRDTYLLLAVTFLAGACGGELIDPLPPPPPPPGTITPSFALRIGNNAFDQVSDLAVDPDGSVYVAGTFAFGRLRSRHRHPLSDQPRLSDGFLPSTAPADR